MKVASVSCPPRHAAVGHQTGDPRRRTFCSRRGRPSSRAPRVRHPGRLRRDQRRPGHAGPTCPAFLADAQLRKDIIVARINDKAYAGSASFTVEVVKAPRPSPSIPMLPASCIPRPHQPGRVGHHAGGRRRHRRPGVIYVSASAVRRCAHRARGLANAHDGFDLRDRQGPVHDLERLRAWVEPSTIPSVRPPPSRTSAPPAAPRFDVDRRHRPLRSWATVHAGEGSVAWNPDRVGRR